MSESAATPDVIRRALDQSRCQVTRSITKRHQVIVGNLETVGGVGLLGRPDSRVPAARTEIVRGRIAVAGVEQLGQVDVGPDPLLNRRVLNEQIAVRTRFFDEFFMQAAYSANGFEVPKDDLMSFGDGSGYLTATLV